MPVRPDHQPLYQTKIAVDMSVALRRQGPVERKFVQYFQPHVPATPGATAEESSVRIQRHPFTYPVRRFRFLICLLLHLLTTLVCGCAQMHFDCCDNWYCVLLCDCLCKSGFSHSVRTPQVLSSARGWQQTLRIVPAWL